MAKLTGKAKEEFKRRMAAGRRKAARKNPKRKPARKAAKKKATAKRAPNANKNRTRKNKGKLTGKAKAAFLKRMAAGRRKASRGNPKRKPTQAKALQRRQTREMGKALRPRKKARRRNSDTGLGAAIAKFEEFHQKAPGAIREYEQAVRYRQNYAEMGKLRELRVFLDTANPDFAITGFGECQAVCTPDGSNIYFIGGDQRLHLAAMEISSDKDLIELGPCTYIEYHTVKGFHDFAPTNYWHRFGEEDGIFPRLGYDRLNGTLFLVGGNYRVKPEGIVN